MNPPVWTPPADLLEELTALLDAVRRAGDAEPSLRAEALANLASWLDDDDGICPLPAEACVDGTSPAARLALLAWVLEQRPEDAARLGEAISSLVLGANGTGFFARTGIASEARLFSELADRLARKLLPRAGGAEDLGQLLGDILEHRAFLRAAPAVLWAQVAAALGRQVPALAEVQTRLQGAVVEAVVVVAVRLAHLGVTEDVRARSGAVALGASPFMRLSRTADRLLHDTSGAAVTLRSLRATLPECRAGLRRARESLEHGSVSTDLVFRLDVAERLLERLELLSGVLDAEPDAGARLLHAVVVLLDAREEDTTLRGLVRSSSRLLARRIVETSAETGEHYIARSADEYRHMWLSATGGGALMALVAPVKYLIGWLKLPLFFAGLAAGTNYAAAFVLMQVLGLTLATKQPSMTAASLAGALGDDSGASGRARMVELIARTTRTQIAAIAGNLGALIPVSVAVHFAVIAAKGAPFFGGKEAEKVLNSHSLVASGSVLFAALTGVWLWLSSLGAGWFDNWIRYRRLPDALREHRRLRRLLGAARVERLAKLVDRSAGPFFGNVLIGMLLGLTPAFAGFFGAPVEIRHITIATASVVMAALSMAPGTLEPAALGWATAGLVAIAAMNFVVSFALALLVALRARDLDAAVTRALVVDVIKKALREPGQFIVPQRGNGSPEPAQAHAGAHEGASARAIPPATDGLSASAAAAAADETEAGPPRAA